MTMSDRGIHPDLLEEEKATQETQEAQEAPSPPGRPAGRRQARAPEPPPEQPQAPSEGEPPSEPAEPPDWFAQVREAKEPAEAFKLFTTNLPRDAIEHDPTIQGWVNQKANNLNARRQAEAEREAAERAKLEAARTNDLYALGEITQRELQERLQQQAAAQAAGPFMDGVVLFQQNLPEALQKAVAGKTFGEGKGQAAGVAEYLQFLHEEGVKLATEQSVRARESALRKSVLTEVNGNEPVPERESGTPGRVREVTDEQIAAMTLREYDALFDENGHPKPGVRHRPTRSVPLRQP